MTAREAMAGLTYVGVAERGSDGWWISFPAFPGVTSAAETLPALLVNAPDALASAIEAMIADGMDLPAPVADDPAATDIDRSGYRDPIVALVSIEAVGQSGSVDVTLDEGLVARLDDLGARTHTTRSALLARGARLVLAGAS